MWVLDQDTEAAEGAAKGCSETRVQDLGVQEGEDLWEAGSDEAHTEVRRAVSIAKCEKIGTGRDKEKRGAYDAYIVVRNVARKAEERPAARRILRRTGSGRPVSPRRLKRMWGMRWTCKALSSLE